MSLCRPRPWAIILAAGDGSRLRDALQGERKQFVSFRGAPLYWQSALVMARAGRPAGIVFVFPPESIDSERARLEALDDGHFLGIPWRCASGGKRRQDSVMNGISALPEGTGLVLVHDAARPFASPRLVRSVCAALENGAVAVIPGVHVSDTIKLAEGGFVRSTLPRDSLVAVQTPQGFDARLLAAAHAMSGGETVTDDAALMEMAGHEVLVVPGERSNVKLTNPEDLDILARERSFAPCCALGYDVHRIGGDRPLRLGGVDIPGGVRVIAHSDGDVLLHALMDALLALAALGDIGSHFPDSDERYSGISSAVLLDEVLALLRPFRLRISHVDLTVAAQSPRLAPYAAEIRRNVARLLSLQPGQVSFKATTEEGLGFTGRKEGIKAWALVSGIKG